MPWVNHLRCLIFMFIFWYWQVNTGWAAAQSSSCLVRWVHSRESGRLCWKGEKRNTGMKPKPKCFTVLLISHQCDTHSKSLPQTSSETVLFQLSGKHLHRDMLFACCGYYIVYSSSKPCISCCPHAEYLLSLSIHANLTWSNILNTESREDSKWDKKTPGQTQTEKNMNKMPNICYFFHDEMSGSHEKSDEQLHLGLTLQLKN